MKGNLLIIIAKSTNQKGYLYRNKNFKVISFSTLIIGLGGKIYELALPLMVYDISHSPITMTVMKGIELLPNLLLACFIGVLIDRANLKKWSLLMIFLQILVLTGMFLLIKNGFTHLIEFYLAGFLLMTFNYGYLNARVSIVKKSVPEELLVAANAKLSFFETIVSLLGPLLSGLLLSISDLHIGILITAICMCMALWMFNSLTIDTASLQRNQTSFLEELKEGWNELRSNKPLWTITILVIFLNSTFGMFSSLIIYFAKDVLDSSNMMIGILFTIMGVGGLVGSIIVEKLPQWLNAGKIIGLTIVTLGLGFWLMSIAQGYLLMAISLFIVGSSSTVQSVTIWSLRQASTPAHLMGRVSGITGSMFKLGAPFVIFFAGWIANTLGISTVFMLAAVINLLLYLVYIKLLIYKI